MPQKIVIPFRKKESVRLLLKNDASSSNSMFSLLLLHVIRSNQNLSFVPLNSRCMKAESFIDRKTINQHRKLKLIPNGF